MLDDYICTITCEEYYRNDADVTAEDAVIFCRDATASESHSTATVYDCRVEATAHEV